MAHHAVIIEIRGQKYEVAAKGARLKGRLAAMNPVFAGDVVRGGNDAAPPIPADCQRLPAQFGMANLFCRGEESVEVDMQEHFAHVIILMK